MSYAVYQACKQSKNESLCFDVSTTLADGIVAISVIALGVLSLYSILPFQIPPVGSYLLIGLGGIVIASDVILFVIYSRIGDSPCSLLEGSIAEKRQKKANSLIVSGKNLKAQRKHKEALEKFQQALKFIRKALGPGSKNEAETLGEIGSCFRSERKYQEALENDEKALEIQTALGDADAARLSLSNIAYCLEQQADCLRQQKKYDEAIEKYQQALTERRKVTLEVRRDITTDEKTAFIFLQIAACYKTQKKYEEAIEALKQSVEIKRFKYASLYHIGFCLGELKKYEEAIESFEAALEELRRRERGEEDPDIKKCLKKIEICREHLN